MILEVEFKIFSSSSLQKTPQIPHILSRSLFLAANPSSFHFSKSADFSIVLREVDNVSRYGSVELDENQRVVRFNEKGEQTGKGNINGGIYLINKKFFEKNKFADKFSLEKDCFEKLYKTHPFYGIVCKQYFLDIGIPEDYKTAQDDFKKFEY